MFRKIVKLLIPSSLFQLIEPWGHWCEAFLANVVYGFPGRGMKVIGITGTDGKSTTTTMIATMLRNAGYKIGMITTITIDTGNGPKPNPTRLTAIAAFPFQKVLKQMRAEKLDYLVLETPSFAMAQHRNWGVKYYLAVMTNVTHEHLDYHKTFERYRDAKKRLFTLTGRNQQGTGVGIINAEDPSAELFAAEVPKPITYGVKAGDLRATNIKSTPAGSDFKATLQGRSLQLHVNIPGSFNVYNAMAAAGAGIALGLTDLQIEEGIASLDSVEGRMTHINEGQDFTAIVDYAHTPDAFEKIFAEIRPLTKGKIICVFGSAGRRDKAKRGIQGNVAGKLCDVVVVTEEDDRDEDGLAILAEIASGAEKAGKKRDLNLFLIHDRAEAIGRAINLAKKGDIVVALGKGHEKSIIGPTGKRVWDEAGEVRKALRNLHK